MYAVDLSVIGDVNFYHLVKMMCKVLLFKVSFPLLLSILWERYFNNM